MKASTFRTWEWIAILAIAAACYGAIFLRLGHMPIMLWDEGSFAVTALEMSENGKFFASYFEGKPDFILNFKPHMNVWAQVLCFKLFGYNEIALRLPAAICATITAFFLFFYLRKKTGCITASITASLTLLCSFGYIMDHCARTGDTDSMLVMCLTLAAINFFEYTEAFERRRLSLFFLFFLLAALTKGISAFLVLPGLLIYLLFKGKLLIVLKEKTLYLHILGIALIISAYYYVRELSVPGYFKTMFDSEIGRFWNKNLEGAVHHHPFNYYIKILLESYLHPWIYLIVPAYLFIRFNKRTRAFRNLADFSLIYAVAHLLVISISKTKLPWYPAPEYPMFALLTALLIATIESYEFSTKLPAAAKALILAGIFSLPYKKIIDSIISQGTDWHAVQYERYIRKIHAQKGGSLLVTDSEMNSHLTFYSQVLPKEGIALEKLPPSHKFRPGNVIITCNPAMQEEIKKRYEVKMIDQEFRCSCMEVQSEERDVKQ